ncbi:MAG: hypothetical protein KC591_11000 [Gemmatimonadetes bacterium]|nr:hypothetical protein [Gemmatimonadota bacterium]
MDWQGRAFQYGLVFVGTGTVALAVKILGDASQSRLAGVVAMLPIKILATFLIVGSLLGSRGLQDATSGMLAGLLSIAALIVSVRVASARWGAGASVAVGMAVWLVVLLAVEWWRRSS